MGKLAIASILVALSISSTVQADDAKPPAPHTIPFPSGAGGIAFGTTRARVLKTRGCAADREDVNYAHCRLSDDVLGFPAFATLTFCGAKICTIVIGHSRDESASDADWVHEYSDLEQRLRGKYGKPDAVAQASDACLSGPSSLLACIASKALDASTWWYWTVDGQPSARICMTLKTDHLYIMYQSAPSLNAVEAKHQRQEDAL